jgi:hypothetical protein
MELLIVAMELLIVAMELIIAVELIIVMGAMYLAILRNTPPVSPPLTIILIYIFFKAIHAHSL